MNRTPPDNALTVVVLSVLVFALALVSVDFSGQTATNRFEAANVRADGNSGLGSSSKFHADLSIRGNRRETAGGLPQRRLPSATMIRKFENLGSKGLEYVLTSRSVRSILNSSEGDEISLPVAAENDVDSLAGRVLMASQLRVKGCWLRAVELSGLEKTVLSVAFETDGLIHAQIFSLFDEFAWEGVARPGEAIVLRKVARRDIVPVCASPPTDGGGVEVGGETGNGPASGEPPWCA